MHAGEGQTALLLAANLFCLFALYYVLKTVRESLILSESGAVVKSYAAAGQALLLLGLVPAYGAIASRVSRIPLISSVTMFFASNLVIFYLLGVAGNSGRRGVLPLAWHLQPDGALAVLGVRQRHLYAKSGATGCSPIVGVGTSLGAWIGAEAASEVFDSLGPYRLMLVAAGGLVRLPAPDSLDRPTRSGDRRGKKEQQAAEEQPLGKEGGFQLVLAQRYLLYIALLIMVLNIVNTLGGFMLGSFVETEARRAVATGRGRRPQRGRLDR